MSNLPLTATTFLTATLLVTIMCGGGGVSGQPMAPAPPPMPDCLTSLFNMSDCLTYVTAGSKSAKPDKPCCPELAGLVESAPQCLCVLLSGNTAEEYGVKIDMSRALKLPSICGVTTPPPSLCSVIGIPIGAPMSNDGSISPVAPAPHRAHIAPMAPNRSTMPDNMAPGPSTPSAQESNDNGGSNKIGKSTLQTLPIAFMIIISFF